MASSEWPGRWLVVSQRLSREMLGGSKRDLGPGLMGSASGVVQRLVMVEW